MTTEPTYDDAGYVMASDYRRSILRSLDDSPATPTDLSSDTDIALSHTSRTLAELKSNGYVELLVSEERKVGRIYGLTDTGAAVVALIEEEILI